MKRAWRFAYVEYTFRIRILRKRGTDLGAAGVTGVTDLRGIEYRILGLMLGDQGFDGASIGICAQGTPAVLADLTLQASQDRSAAPLQPGRPRKRTGAAAASAPA